MPAILFVAAGLIVAVDLLVLRSVGRRVRGRGRRIELAVALVTWLVETGLLALILLVVSGSVLPGSIVQARDAVNLAWLELSLVTGMAVALVTLSRIWGVPSLADVGLGRSSGGHSQRDFAVGLALGTAGASIPLVAGLAGGWSRLSEVSDLPRAAGILAAGGLFFLAAGAFEELLFRGGLFALVARIAGLPAAWVVSVGVFGLVHGLDPGASLMAVLSIGLAGLALTLALVRTGALWLSIGFHASWNWALGCLFGFTVSGVDFGSVLHVEMASTAPSWATGGTFGPEASLPGVAAFGLATVVFWWYSRGRSGASALFPMGCPERVRAAAPAPEGAPDSAAATM